ncbi:MAG: 8-oxoguanine DNA glycosylase [Nanohaloarchaea archaeon]|nr:8-oxoguanine DNA glycosylase [Candidatus Nanohaloarchaea archaeon]
MERHEIAAENFDLELTMTCGQTFCWHRTKGDLYGEGTSKFYTYRDKKPIFVEQEGDVIFAETEHSKEEVKKALGLHKDLESVFSNLPEDESLEKAREEYWGLRVVNDDFFQCLIGYLLSPQNRIPRIKEMFDEIARNFGSVEQVNGEEVLRFPTPEELSKASEDDLRAIGTGYRAKYIVETLDILQDGFDHNELDSMDYVEAREHMQNLYGVGDKVADCVLLFSKGFHEAAPIDTWGKKFLEQLYPELHSEDYEEASENMREHFGEHTGYAQEYLFHAARNGVIEVE